MGGRELFYRLIAHVKFRGVITAPSGQIWELQQGLIALSTLLLKGEQQEEPLIKLLSGSWLLDQISYHNKKRKEAKYKCIQCVYYIPFLKHF